jgi:hypothetical protein
MELSTLTEPSWIAPLQFFNPTFGYASKIHGDVKREIKHKVVEVLPVPLALDHAHLFDAATGATLRTR